MEMEVFKFGPTRSYLIANEVIFDFNAFGLIKQIDPI